MMSKYFKILLILCCLGWLIVISACSSEKYPEGLYAEINTAKGTIVVFLEMEKTPLTVTNFVGLAEGTVNNTALSKGIPFYDGTAFHRVVPGHVIQAGIPNNGKDDGPGYNYYNEIHPQLSHNKAGMVGIANGGPHTNNCQFYITLGDRSYLDGDYIVFGHVVEGMKVVNSISQDDKIESIKIVRIGDKAKAFVADTKGLNQLRETVKNRVLAEEKEKRRLEEEKIQKTWPNAQISESGIKYVVLMEGEGTPPAEGSVVTLVYKGEFLNGGWKFGSSAGKGLPLPQAEGQTFKITMGKDSVMPGLELALREMKKGEKRVLIFLPEHGFGNSGFYSPEKKGERRFVIPPNTTLVLELEVIYIK